MRRLAQPEHGTLVSGILFHVWPGYGPTENLLLEHPPEPVWVPGGPVPPGLGEKGTDCVWTHLGFDFEDLHECPHSRAHVTGTRRHDYRIEGFGGGDGPTPKLESLIANDEGCVVCGLDAMEQFCRAGFTGVRFRPVPVDWHADQFPPTEFYLLEPRTACESRSRVVEGGPNACAQCGWGPIACPGCWHFERECPRCKQLAVVSEREWDHDADVIVIQNGLRRAQIIDGAAWSGDDIVTLGGSAVVCTRRVVRWLFENRFGPFEISPLRIDVDSLSPELAARVEELRRL